MDIKTKITINLTPEYCEAILAEYLKRKGYEVKDVKAQTANVSAGFGTQERTEVVFTGFDCIVEKLA